MHSSMFSSGKFCLFFFIAVFFITPAYAFGAGEIPEDDDWTGYAWRHGDIANVLSLLPISFLTKYAFTKLEQKQVYFGNWLRDYSQVMDKSLLSKLPPAILQSIVSVLAFMEFGLATGDFDVTSERLGCYKHVEHIDNPKGYDSDCQMYDKRLRGPVNEMECAIDLRTGMKNYIANNDGDWDTSAKHIARTLRECISLGRSGQNGDRQSMVKALILLGNALHTLEDFAAHSNFVELCLHEMGKDGVFPFVGDKCRIPVPSRTDKLVAPLVTGTFGPLDVLNSILGEMDDKAAVRNKGTLRDLEMRLNSGGNGFAGVFATLKSTIGALSFFFKGDDENRMNGLLSSIANSEKKARTEPMTYDPVAGTLAQTPNALWQAIEPVFIFHDNIVKWFMDNEDWFEIPGKKTVEKCVNDLVYALLAAIIEPSVKAMRDAVKAAKNQTLENSQQDTERLFAEDSDCSDPSHSDIAKDHFGNVLNHPAGRVASVTTNWVVQQIVACWDQKDKAVEPVINDILSILHHPSFPQNKTDIQTYMFDAVKNWWDFKEFDSQEKDKVLGLLTKESVKHRGHDDHTVDLKELQDKHEKGFAKFPGSRPETKTKEREGLLNDLKKALEGAAKAIEETAEKVKNGLIDGAAVVSKAVDEFVDDTVDTVKGVAGKVADKAEEVVNDVVDTGKKVVDGVVDTGKKVVDTAEQAIDDAIDTGKKVVDGVAETGKKVVDGVVDTAEQVADDVADAGKRVVDGVIDTGKEVVDSIADAGSTVADGASFVASEAASLISDAGSEVESVVSDIGDAASTAVDTAVDTVQVAANDVVICLDGAVDQGKRKFEEISSDIGEALDDINPFKKISSWW